MNQFNDKTIGFIGAGKMGSALIKVMVAKKIFQSDRIIVSDIIQEQLDKIKEETGVQTTSDNRKVVGFGDIIVFTVPYSACRDILVSIRDLVKDKLFINVSVPVDPEKPSRLIQPEDGSASELAQTILGEETPVVAAFQNIATLALENLSETLDNDPDRDVLICGKSKKAKQTVLELVQCMGMRGLDAGPLRNARIIEGLTIVLLGMNIRYKKKDMGIKITGL